MSFNNKRANNRSKKSTRTRIISISILTILGLGASQFAPAWAGKIMSKALIDPDLEIAVSNHFKKRFFNLINADDQQQSKLSELLTKQSEEARPIRTQIREKLLELSDLMANESTTDDALRSKIEEVRILREQIREKRLNSMLEARALLTPEQKKTVSSRIRGILTGNPRI